MKIILRLALIVFCFLVFAAIGFGLADWGSSGSTQNVNKTMPVTANAQHNFILVQVDQLDAAQPQLVSVWFVSYSLTGENRPRIAIAQLYPSEAANDLDEVLSLNAHAEPSAEFWRRLRGLNIAQWQGYLVMDNLTLQRFMEWLHGPGDYPPIFADESQSNRQEKELLQATCERMIGIDLRERSDLQWTDLVPVHMHTDLTMDMAFSYWKEITNAPELDRCDVILMSHAKAP